MSLLKLGLVGCGHIGRAVHLQTLKRLPNVQVTALADSDAACLEAAHGQCPDARLFNDFRELMEDRDVEAVVICLPNAFHADAAVAAFERNKHIYLEKPLALNLDEGKRVLEAWRRASRIGMIGFNYRYNPLHREMRHQIHSGTIGELTGVRSLWTNSSDHIRAWKATRQTGGGVLLDLASHHFDLIRFWFDQDIVEVYATVRSLRMEGDTATVQLRLANGLLVQNFFSLSSIVDERFEVYGAKGKLSFDRFNSWNIELTDLGARSIPSRYLRRVISAVPHSRFALNKLRSPGLEPSFSAALGHFVEAALTNQQIHPDFDDGFKSLEAVIAAEESARQGVPIALSQGAR